MKLQKIKIKFEIYYLLTFYVHAIPTYLALSNNNKYDRQLTAWQHDGPKIDPTCFRRWKMG